jgi:hypothetical protein
MSPSSRCSTGSFLRCVRSSVLYSGMGGKRAIGAGRKGFAAPASVAVARSREDSLMLEEVVLEDANDSARRESECR